MEFDKETLKLLVDTLEGELTDQIEIITDGLLKLEKGPSGDERRSSLEAIFRAAHNIKGAARGVGVSTVAEISHHMETFFSALKHKNMNPEPEHIDLCLEAVDRMTEAMSAFADETPDSFDAKELYNRLDQAIASGRSTKDQVSKEETAPPKKKIKERAVATPSSVAPPLPEPDRVQAGKLKKEKEGEARPAAHVSAAVEAIKVTVDKIEKIGALTEELQSAKIESEDHLKDLKGVAINARELATSFSMINPVVKGEMRRRLSPDAVAFVDETMETVATLSENAARVSKAVESAVNSLGLVTSSLVNDTRMLRLVPASTLLNSAGRTIRDLARELGKKVDIEINGAEIEMDRAVLDGLRDPLNHLLRNAVDHGIEPPLERIKAFKPETAKVIIDLEGRGSTIILFIEDDGGGIDAGKIRAAAVKKGVTTETEAERLSDEEVINLIFRPGFSSKEIVTNISGRGVGLDVVGTNLHRLKGSVAVSTEFGSWTRFTLTLPLTLVTERGLMVRAGGAEFVIPTNSVNKVMEIGPDDIVDVEASQALLIDGVPIPIRGLATALGLEEREPASSKRLPVAVLSGVRGSVAFLVEEVVGEREIVIKTLEPPLYSVRNITGATLTGRGEIIMVLNPIDLVENALGTGLSDRLFDEPGEDEEQEIEILAVDDSVTTRTLLKSVLEHSGYTVTTAVNGKEAWEILQKKRFDLIVTDLQMPIMDGFEFTERVKTNEKFKEVPVIMVTSLTSEEDKKRGIEVGADAYIVKAQFESRALLEVIEQWV